MKYKILITCTALLALSLLLNIALLGKLHHTFIKLQTVRTLPNETIATQQAVVPKPFSKLYVLGDSRAQMWGFSQQLSTRTNIENIATGGFTSSQVLTTINNKKALLNNQFVLLQLGINDIHWIRQIPYQSQQKILHNLERNIKYIIETLTESSNKIIISTIFPPQLPPILRRIYWPTNAFEIIEDLNSTIKELALTNNIVLLDSHSILANNNTLFLQNEFIDDDFFLHINQKGYNELNIALDKIFFQLQEVSFEK